MQSTKKTFKSIAKIILGILFIYILYIIIILIYGTLTDFQPAEKIPIQQHIALKNSHQNTLEKNHLKIINWNIGYFGLGQKADFFYDVNGFFTNSGKMVRSPEKDVQSYTEGIVNFIQNHLDADFFLLQEVDSISRRSYYLNGVKLLAETASEFHYAFAANYKSDFVPIPLLMPWDAIGKVHSGLLTLSKYKSTETTRYQFPGAFDWPLRIFNLDRCMLVHKIPTYLGKDLILINAHLSAYDKNGALKKQEMAYLKKYITAAYANGHYVIVGADWNQLAPNIPNDLFFPNEKDHNPGNIPSDFLPTDWTWALDKNTPTNRKLYEIYNKEKTFQNLIDYYLVSPNIKVKKVETIDLDFKYSDHQPVLLEIELLEQ